jgi:hypothetical protein
MAVMVPDTVSTVTCDDCPGASRVVACERDRRAGVVRVTVLLGCVRCEGSSTPIAAL